MQLIINTHNVLAFTNQLKNLHRSGLPSAVRGTLNRAVYDFKTKTMPSTANDVFEQRQKNFFTANSKFENARGFDISSMKSTVGFYSNNLKGDNNYSVRDLEEQEHGGVINKRSFIPLPDARVSKSNSRNVRPNARLSAIKKIITGNDAKGSNWAQRAIKSAVFAGSDGMVLIVGKKNSVLWKINSLRRGKNGNMIFKKTKLYSFSKNRSVKVHATHFAQISATKTAQKMDEFYIIEAKRQIAKYLG